MPSDTESKSEIKRGERGLFLPGNAPGPGRPAGESIKRRLLTFARNELGAEGMADFYKSYFRAVKEKEDSWQAKHFANLALDERVLSEIDTVLMRAEKQDNDFQHYRIHKSAFDIQQGLLLSKNRYKFVMAGRRGGKTEYFARAICDVLLEGGRAHYIHKTLTTGIEQIWQLVVNLCGELGLVISEHHRNEGTLTLENGGFFKVSGNVTVEDREKKRGEKWHLVIIDEAQSQAALLSLVESIIEPELIDFGGTLVVGGTGPRVRGTYWEALYLGQWSDGRPLYPGALRLNWNLSQNPYIPDHEKALETIRKDKGLSELDPLYVREYLGRIAYDDDALVYRLGAGNYYTDDELALWINSQPITDIRFTAGLDFGFEDADAFGIICYSQTRPERFLVHEWKANRKSTEEIASALRGGLEYVRASPLFAKVEDVHKRFQIFGDEGGLGKQIAYDLNVIYKLPVYAAYKASKDLAVELLQDEVRHGLFKVRKGGIFDDEALKTIFKRNDQDQITREIDDETYHPDMGDAVLYGMRLPWWFTKKISG